MNENKSFNGIYYSKYIMSWLRAGGCLRTFSDYELFVKWLKSLDIPEEVIEDIEVMAIGSSSLTMDARRFIKENVNK